MFKLLNFLLTKLVESTGFSRWIFLFFTRILAVPQRKVRGVALKIVIPLNQVGVYDQFKSWETREPETLDWIDTFIPESIFFDVGASFGTETLYAALKSNPPKKIVSFDLDLEATFMLAYNLQLNNINCVEHYYLGLSAQADFIKMAEPTNYACVPNRPKYDKVSWRTWSLSLDEFVEKTGLMPNYLKIDVDGAETDLIVGMQKTLYNPALHSILIEVSPHTAPPIAERLINAGFVQTYQSPTRIFSDDSTVNLIYTRKEML